MFYVKYSKKLSPIKLYLYNRWCIMQLELDLTAMELTYHLKGNLTCRQKIKQKHVKTDWFIIKVEVVQERNEIQQSRLIHETERMLVRLLRGNSPPLPAFPPQLSGWLLTLGAAPPCVAATTSLARASRPGPPTIEEVIKPYWPPRTVNFKKAATAKGHERKSFVSGRHFTR